MTIQTQLVDARNWAEMKPLLIDRVSNGELIGFDIETHDADAHQGIREYRGKNSARVFDARRTTVCGFSVYPDETDTAFYLNLAHADVENRIPWLEAREVLDARSPDAHWICHNAPFELTMMGNSLAYELDNVICTLQMAVSAYGPDEYDFNKFVNAGLGGISKLLGKAGRAFHNYETGQTMNTEQSDVFSQVTSKQSDAEWSYNGFVNDITYGYGLKKAVKSFFGVDMTTFKEVIGDREHMGQLTGEEVAAYGADDSYWCVRLFHRLLQFMMATNPKVIRTFFEQENPMIYVYSDIWRTGIKSNPEGIKRYRETERENMAEALRRLKKSVNDLLPFPDDLNEGLLEHEGWYQKNAAKYRRQIEQWAALPDSDDDFTQCCQVAGSVSKPWALERGEKAPTGPNFTHYMMMRTAIYDLARQRPMRMNGKVQSDGENRGRLIDRIKKQKEVSDWDGRLDASLKMIEAINDMAKIEQRMKLFLNPYTKLVDPETGRMYPQISSQLATRRMGSQNPNVMQESKRDPASTYIRGFTQADQDDHVLVSIDWSQIELVLVGEFSGDPEFKKAYGQLPYRDLHLGAAADALKVMIPEMTEDLMNALSDMAADEIKAINERILLDVNGAEMEPGKAKKYWRTEVGKGSNFNYWYSGALSTVGQRLGWSPDMMWEATDLYRNRFAVAEQWRKETIAKGQRDGYVELPDGHRRVKFEATPRWAHMFRERFMVSGHQGIARFGQEVVKAVQRRANNQLVNALIQGSCATLAKRSILRIDEQIAKQGFDARFKKPVHDELVWSVNRREVVPFIKMAKQVMCNHPDIINDLVIDATASVGLTFEPHNSDKAPFGQVEIDEAPKLPFIPVDTVDKPMNDNQIEETVEYLYKMAS